ncbi:hypothetical protein EPIR_3106 [Erwinia piriflorinigrans CFBP 5888]|uniref:Transposase n=1 Tax=Erwinia piriflorinigrans CFBP 5888 TaxID=1161919 RepID=V5ZC07_9GAMM|nr:hypothetical protein EPIR_3106 [Erwinia piriflorinigrans CFBP 5888]
MRSSGMKKTRYTEEQIAFALKQADSCTQCMNSFDESDYR